MPNRWIWPFELEQQIGSGAMGEVYLARYVKNDRRVALKLLPAEAASNRTLVARFEREMEILKELKHPHIIQCFGGTCDSAQRFYAMEFVEGGTVADLLEQKGQLSCEETVSFGIQICGALEHAHAHGVVHRDLKPGNLMVTNSGKIKLGDFGLALVSTGNKLTAEGKTLGTLHYMSPEQIRGDPPLSGLSDLYSLGCVLFEMLTGQPPFDAEAAGQILHLHIHRAPPMVTSIRPDCPPALEQLINDLLAKDPANRPSSANVVAKRLLPLLKGSSEEAEAAERTTRYEVTATPRSASQGRWKPDRRHLALALAVVAVIAVWSLFRPAPATDGGMAVQLWKEAISSGQPQVRLAAIQAVGKIGPQAAPAVPELIAALEDADSKIRTEAAISLGKIGKGAESALGHLNRHHRDDSWPLVRENALASIKQIQSAPANPGGGGGWLRSILSLALISGGVWAWIKWPAG